MKQVELPSRSDSEESIARITCDNVRKPEGGKLSELKSPRTEDPPSENRLTTCSKRSFRLMEVCENESEMEDSIISKKMKRLPSSENGDNTNKTAFFGASGMKPRSRSVTHGEGTKDLVLNEMNFLTKGNVSPCEGSVGSEENEQEDFNGLAEGFSDGVWENVPAVTPGTTFDSLSQGISYNFEDSVTQEDVLHKKVPTFVTKYEVEDGSAFSSYFQDAQSVTQDAVVSEATLPDEMKEAEGKMRQIEKYDQKSNHENELFLTSRISSVNSEIFSRFIKRKSEKVGFQG